MLHEFKEENVGSFFGLTTDHVREYAYFARYKTLIALHWNRSEVSVVLVIDGVSVSLKPNELTTTTYFQHVKILDSSYLLTSFVFNREFYCINDHDHEVSCNGIIFFGTQAQPIVTLCDAEIRKFGMLMEVIEDEFKTRDRSQAEMLRVLLKRLIIKVTRLAKEQSRFAQVSESQIDTIRKFNVLVDMHFREKHKVADYADLLFKSPKTLSNLFAKYNQQSPLNIIHDRIVLEAKRLLIYTDKNVKEIAFEVGFDDTGSFHKLFKKQVSVTPVDFKQSHKLVFSQ